LICPLELSQRLHPQVKALLLSATHECKQV
jgi:hypothetical protein